MQHTSKWSFRWDKYSTLKIYLPFLSFVSVSNLFAFHPLGSDRKKKCHRLEVGEGELAGLWEVCQPSAGLRLKPLGLSGDPAKSYEEKQGVDTVCRHIICSDVIF